MPNTVTSPNMNIVTPIVGVEIGPAWASELYTALISTIDAHDHSAGKGVRVTPAGLNINADLSYMALGTSYNAKDLRSTRYTPQGSALVLGTDVGCLYNVSGDAYWNNGAGTPIQLTKNGVVNASTLIWPLHPGTAGGTILSTDPYLIYYADTSGVAQSFNLPQSSSLSAGRTYLFDDIKANSQTNNISLVPNGTDKINNVNGTFTIASNGSQTLLSTDGAGNWYAVTIGPPPTWANDLAGSSLTHQWVASISGNGGAGGTVPLNANTFQFGQTQASPTFSQAQQANGSNPNNMNFSPQAPGAAATNATTGTPGSALCNFANPVNGGANASLQIAQPPGTTGIALQQYPGGSFWAIYFGANARAPGSTNYQFLCNDAGTVTQLQGVQTLQLRGPGTAVEIYSPAGCMYRCDASGTQLFSTTMSLGGGGFVLGIAQASVVPTSASTNGGVIYFNAGSPGTFGLVAAGISFVGFQANPTIGQDSISTASGTTLTVQGQGATGAAHNGGPLALAGGSSGSATPGPVLMQSPPGTTLAEFGNAGFQCATVSLSIAAGGTFTLSQAQYKFPYIILTGSLAANATVVLPTVIGAEWIVDATAVTLNAHTITLQANGVNWATTIGIVNLYSVIYGGAGKLYGTALTP